MFDKIKKLKQLRDLQAALKEERIEIEKEGTKIVINGKLEIIELCLNPELGKEKQEEILVECFNKAVRKVQMDIASKFSEMQGLAL